MKFEQFKRAVLEAGQAANAASRGRLNWGGCGVYASLLIDELAKYGISAKAVSLNHGQVDLNALREAVPANGRLHMDTWYDTSENIGMSDPFPHVGVAALFDNRTWLIDSKGIQPADNIFIHDMWNYNVGEGHWTPDEIRAFAFGRKKTWNSDFNRRCIPRIRKAVERALMDNLMEQDV